MGPAGLGEDAYINTHLEDQFLEDLNSMCIHVEQFLLHSTRSTDNTV